MNANALLGAPDPGAYLKQAEAAALLGVSESTVRRAVARGDLPAFRLEIRTRRELPNALPDFESQLASA